VIARLFCLALVGLLLVCGSTGAEEVKLKATIQVALTEPLWGVALGQFKEEIEKRTNKAVLFEVYEKGQRYIDDEVVGAVSSRAVDLGVVGLYQVTKKVPAIEVIEQPFLFNFDALIRAVVSPDSEIRRIIDGAILEKLGVRVLWWQSLGSQVIVSKGRDLTDPGNIKGQRIRTFGPATSHMAERCGGVPTVLSAFKMTEAMRKNELDMVMASIPAVPNRDLWQVADTVTRTWHAPVEYVALINEKTWQSLSPSRQALFVEVARKVEQKVRDRLAEIEADYYKFAVEKGMKIYDLTADQVADWRACSAAVIDDYMSEHPELAYQLLAAYGRLRTEPCCSSAPHAGSFSRH